MTDAALGYDSAYRIWDATANPPAFVDVGEVFNITPPGGTADRVDATHMKSPGRRREYIAGLIDSGEASFEINYVPGNPTDVFLRRLQTSGEIVQHQIEFANGVTVTYDASITGYEKTVPLDDRMTATITVAPSGDETWSAAAAPDNLVLPAISGLAKEGETLTAWEGVWLNSPTFTYQWMADGTPIAGAISSSYTLDGTYVGDPITVEVTATNSAGSDTATSIPTADVVGA